MARPRSCAVAHASIATRAGGCLARKPSNCARDTFLRNIGRQSCRGTDSDGKGHTAPYTDVYDWQ